MPLVCIGVITIMFGWMFPIDAAGKTYELLLSVATKITTLPGATITLPHISNAALVCIILGLMCVMFIRPLRIKINYILGAVFICIGVTIVITTPRPVFYVTPDHELAAFVGENKKLEFTKSRASNHYFAFDTWRQMNGESIGVKNIRRKPVDGVWIYKTQNFTLAYIQKYVPLSKNIARMCRDENIDYIISYFQIDAPQCDHKILRSGFVIYPSGKIRYVPTRRPWHSPH